MRRATIMILAFALLLQGAIAFADHGDWTYKGGNEGLLLMDAFGLDETTVIFSGITQSSEFGMDFIFKSTNSGSTITSILGSTFTGTNICEMLALFELGTSSDFPDINNGVMLGLGFPQDCIDACDGLGEAEAFVQMFLCMLQAGTKVTYTHDGGTTWDSNVLEGGAEEMLSFVDMLDANTGYAAGDTGLIQKTTDGGETWVDVSPATTFNDAYVNYITFLDENTGYLGSGNWESEKSDKSGSVEDSYEWQRMMSLYKRDPSFRFQFDEYRNSTKDTKAFNSDGGVWKTTDGGQTWTRLFESYTEAVSGVSFFDELHGVIYTDKMQSDILSNSSVYYTTDGGETWVEAALPGPLPDLPGFGSGRYFISDVKMVGKKLVYASGAADKAGGLAYSLMLYSEDGGATWQEDTNYDYSGSTRFGNGLMFMGWLNGNKAWVAGTSFERAMYDADNFAPVADAGEDMTYYVGNTVPMDGTGSYDDNGDPLEYLWEQASGPDAGTFNNTQEISNFVAPEVGTYVFKLTVTETMGAGLTDDDEVTFTISDATDDDDDTVDDDDSTEDDDDSGDDDGGAEDDEEEDDDDEGCCG